MSTTEVQLYTVVLQYRTAAHAQPYLYSCRTKFSFLFFCDLPFQCILLNLVLVYRYSCTAVLSIVCTKLYGYVYSCTCIRLHYTRTEFLKSEYRTAILNLVPVLVGGRVYEQYSFASVNVSLRHANFSRSRSLAKTEFCRFQFHIRDDQDTTCTRVEPPPPSKSQGLTRRRRGLPLFWPSFHFQFQ